MWLFDNIFADQNTATAMLDPLTTTAEKESAAKAEKAALETKEATKPEEILAIPSEESDTPLLDSEISFDIWGIDLPDFDAVTAEAPTDDASSTWGMFLSGGKALSASASEPEITETSTSDISIGLLQGATAGSSDAIMDAVPTETIIEPVIDLATPITISESETLVKVEEVPPTELQMDNVFSAGSSLMDMLGDMPSVDAITPVTLEATPIEATPIETATLTPEPVIAFVTPEPIVDTRIPETTDAVLTSSSLFTDSDTDDSTLLSVISPIAVDENSPLHEMLREFIAKLEKFESESDVLDTKAATAQSKIQAKRIKLEDEYHARLSAIESEQQYITGGKAARQEEKAKLRKIIENLEKEIA